jgi:predicted aminopeptidase
MTDRQHRKRRRALRVLGWTGLALILLATAMVILSREVRFVVRAGYEEARILLARQDITELLADTSVPAARREQLALVLAARTYAADSLGLDAGDTYTTFAEIRRDTLLLVLTASPWNRIEAYTWRYPIVGTVPYKGFFDFDNGRAEAARLAEAGYDIYLRPSPAFSTLGWFNDPLLSTALSRDRTMLAELVIHEIAHNTLYVASATSFNESFAQFVGYRGAEAFFRSRGDSVAAERIRAIWRDQGRLAVFYADVVGSLETLYGSGLPDSALRIARVDLFDRTRRRLAANLDGTLEVFSGERLADRPLNNASLVGARLYLSDIDVFDRVLELFAGDLSATVRAIIDAVDARGEGTPDDAVAGIVSP